MHHADRGLDFLHWWTKIKTSSVANVHKDPNGCNIVEGLLSATDIYRLQMCVRVNDDLIWGFHVVFC